MQKLKAAKEVLSRFCRRVRRYPNELRVVGAEYGDYEVDNMIITGPKHTFYYFRFEYILSTIFSCTTALISLLFLFFGAETPQTSKFILLRYWLRLGVILHLGSAIPKFLILRKLYKIPLLNERLVVRRLMLLVRSNIFFVNEKVSFVMYTYYIFGMGKLASSSICGSMNSDLYRLCHFIISFFLLRLTNLFVRFIVEYYILTRNVTYNSLIDKCASPEDIAAIPILKFQKKLESGLAKEEEQRCGICLRRFQIDDEIKALPCSEKHYFHVVCTDSWLQEQNTCPYCRKQLEFSA